MNTHRANVQMCVIVKTRCFFIILSFKIKPKRIQRTVLEILTKKNSQRIVTRLHDGLFELEIAEIFTTVFFKTIWIWIFFKYCRVLSLKSKKNSLPKRCKPSKNWLRQTEKKIWKRERNMKNGEKSNNKYILTI